VIITSLTDILPEKSQLCLWSYIDTCFVKYWQSDTIQYSAYRDPYIIDTDFDSKQNIILANNEIFSISDWEQVNPGVYLSNDNSSNSEQMHIIPNPFNECTSIHFYIEESCKTKLKIYNLTGKEIYNNEFFVKKGEQKINWNAGYLSSGIYLFCMEINNKTYISKGLLIK
jgi:hypothetical protein